MTESPLADLAEWIADGPPAPAPREQNEAAHPARDPRSDTPAVTENHPAQQVNADARWCELPESLPPWSDGGGIFITGATGFLGAHMVAELAPALEPGQKLFALVRADDHDGARRRLEQTLTTAGLTTPGIGAGSLDSSPVVALAGSLESDRFGLDAALYERLCAEVSLVHHVGASVSFDRGYEGLREANVLGTRRILRFAVENRLKALHFVSSLNVAHVIERCGTRPALEISRLPETLPETVVAAMTGYAVSKWVCERMIQAMARATDGRLRLSISRPALITWSTTTGFANESDWLTRLLRSCLDMRCAIGPAEAASPRWAPLTETTAHGLDLIPVDATARAICRIGELTRQGRLDPGPLAPTFHVSNLAPREKGLISIQHLMDMLVAADLGCPQSDAGFRSLPFKDWLLRVEAEGAPALPILPMLENMNPAQPRARADRFAEIVESQDGPFPVSWPDFDQRVVDSFVRRIREEESSSGATAESPR
jgi:thioester reductase-like protein